MDLYHIFPGHRVPSSVSSGDCPVASHVGGTTRSVGPEGKETRCLRVEACDTLTYPETGPVTLRDGSPPTPRRTPA